MTATAAQRRCEHVRFQLLGNVTRLMERNGGPITAYTIDVTVICQDCSLPFRFVGVPAGSSPYQPMVSVDGLQLRAPLEPALADEIRGRAAVVGHA